MMPTKMQLTGEFVNLSFWRIVMIHKKIFYQ